MTEAFDLHIRMSAGLGSIQNRNKLRAGHRKSPLLDCPTEQDRNRRARRSDPGELGPYLWISNPGAGVAAHQDGHRRIRQRDSCGASPNHPAAARLSSSCHGPRRVDSNGFYSTFGQTRQQDSTAAPDIEDETVESTCMADSVSSSRPGWAEQAHPGGLVQEYERTVEKSEEPVEYPGSNGHPAPNAGSA